MKLTKRGWIEATNIENVSHILYRNSTLVSKHK